MRRATLSLGAAGMLAILLGTAACEPKPDIDTVDDDDVCEPPHIAAPLPEAIQESSGVAASHTYPGVFWTHNDSGWDPVIFAIDSTGAVLASVRVAGTTNRDWEDIELAPCAPGRQDHCLFIGEIGDNNERHPRIAVYRIPEPNPATDTVSDPATAFYATYRDGPRDAEALFVTDQGIHIINKGRNHAIDLYRIPPPYRAGRTTSLVPVQRLAPPPTSISAQVTAAAASPTGDRVVIRTYGGLRFFQMQGDTLAPMGRPASVVAPEQRQGEAVDFTLDDRLILTSETQAEHPASLAIVRCDPLRESPPATDQSGSTP